MGTGINYTKKMDDQNLRDRFVSNFRNDTSIIHAYIVENEIVDKLQKYLNARANGYIHMLFVDNDSLISSITKHTIDSVILGIEYRYRIREYP